MGARIPNLQNAQLEMLLLLLTILKIRFFHTVDFKFSVHLRVLGIVRDNN